MTWNYRIIKQEYPEYEYPDNTTYQIYEVYYDEDNYIEFISSDPQGPFGTSLEEITNDLERMRRALTLPILDMDEVMKGFETSRAADNDDSDTATISQKNMDGHLTNAERYILNSLKIRHPADKGTDLEAIGYTPEELETLPRSVEIDLKLSVANGEMCIALKGIENVFLPNATNPKEMETFQELLGVFGAMLDKIVENPNEFEAARVAEYKEYQKNSPQ